MRNVILWTVVLFCVWLCAALATGVAITAASGFAAFAMTFALAALVVVARRQWLKRRPA